MSKHDLQARPIYHRQRDSIEAHLNIVFVALAMSRWIANHTGWSIKRVVRTTRRYRTIEIQASRPSPPLTHYPPTSTRHSPRSGKPAVH